MLHRFILHLAGPQPARGFLGQWPLSVDGSRAQDTAGIPQCVPVWCLGATSQAQAVAAGLGGQAQADVVTTGQLLSLRGSAWRQKEMEGEGSLLVSLALQRELENAVGRPLWRKPPWDPEGPKLPRGLGAQCDALPASVTEMFLGPLLF